jgi:iron complex outermembrane receptor protein
MTKRNSQSRALTGKHFAMTPVSAAVVAALSPGSAAMAQDDDEYVGIEEIVVTATKRTVSIQDVAQSITAFSTAEIERRGILDMADIAGNLPSISLSSYRAGLNELVYRGISSGGSWRLESQVAMYLDDIPVTAGTTQLDPRLVDIKRVESLPGPQGTLFGSASQTGTLRVITNKPEFDAFSGQVTAEVKSTTGGEDSWDINGHLNIPVSENFALRLVAYSHKDGGYIDNVYSTAPHSVCNPEIATGSENDEAQCDHDGWGLPDGHLNSATPDNAGLEQENFNDYEMTGGRLAALWNISDKWNLLGTFMTQDSTTTGDWGSDTAIGDYKIARFSEEWRKDKWTNFALTIKGDLGFAEFSNSFSTTERDQAYQFDNTHYEAYHTRRKGGYVSYYCNFYNSVNSDYCSDYHFGEYNYYDKYNTGYNGGVYRSLQEAERITNEIRLTSTTDSRFQWMVGAFYENNKDGWVDTGEIPNLDSTVHWAYTQFRSCDMVLNDGVDPSLVQCPAPSPGNTWYQDSYRRDISQVAAFGEVTYDLTDALRVTVGARWFEYDRLVVNDRQWPLYMPVEAIALDGEGASIEEAQESDTSFKFGLSYNLSDDKMIYGLFSQGFRLGGGNNAKAVRVNFVPAIYDPDEVNNYEIGIKSEWFDNRVQLNATIFHMTWEDIQLEVGSDQDGLWWLNGIANGGGGENQGAELDVIWQATDSLRISGNFYTGDAHYTDDWFSPEGVQELWAGTSMQDAASDKFSISADYTFRDVFGGDLWFRYDYYNVGGLYSTWGAAEEANPIHPDYDPTAGYDVDSYEKSNFQIGFERETWSANLMARNLFDDRANTRTSNGDAGWYASSYWGHPGFGEVNNLARPRTISLKFSKRF